MNVPEPRPPPPPNPFRSAHVKTYLKKKKDIDKKIARRSSDG